MNFAETSKRCRLAPAMLALSMTIALAACGKNPGADSSASEVAPQADESILAQAAGSDIAIQPAENALCATATFAEVSAAAGGAFDKVDVIDEEGLHYVDCIYLDSKDLYNGLSMRIVSNAKLVASGGSWPSATAYFDEWGRTGTPVANLGERAAWIELPAGLLVLKDDQALHFSGDKLDPADAAVRARIETLAQQVVARVR